MAYTVQLINIARTIENNADGVAEALLRFHKYLTAAAAGRNSNRSKIAALIARCNGNDIDCLIRILGSGCK